MKYYPDVWKIVQIGGIEVERHHKVLAGWYGGFANGDSWKLSSGIVKIVDGGEYWEIHNHSGSIYICGKQCERFNSYTSSIYHQQQIYAQENEIDFFQVNIDEVLKDYLEVESA